MRLIALAKMVPCALLILVAGGCGDGIRLPHDDGSPPSGVAVVDTEIGNFDLTIDQAQTPVQPVKVNVAFHGRNIRYNRGYKLLLVDIMLFNTSGRSLHKPVTITFRGIEPDTVFMWDPPEGELTWEMEFEDQRPFWGNGNHTEYLTVGFHVALGVPVSFVPEIGVEWGLPDGVIGGRVLEDLDGDGVPDPEEPGAAGVPVRLTGVGNDRVGATRTDENGHYEFTDLDRGEYEVHLEEAAFLTPTGTTIHSYLLEVSEDGVDHVTNADFAVAFTPVDTLALPASADACVLAAGSGFLEYNMGADPHLYLAPLATFHADWSGNSALVRFSPPVGLGPVVSARLEVTVAGYPSGVFNTYDIDVLAVVPSGTRTPWIEGTGSGIGVGMEGVAEPRTAPGVAWRGVENGGDAENHALPDFDPEVAATSTFLQEDVPVGTVLSWDVTDLVNSWLDGSRPNLGLALYETGPEDFNHTMTLWSRDAMLRDYGLGEVGPGPRLVLIYR